MKHKGQINLDHQPRRTTAKRDTVYSECLRRYVEADKVAKANGTARPNMKDFMPIK